MKVLIVCTGTPERAPEGKYNSAEFDAAWERAGKGGICPTPAGRKIDPSGRRVYLAEGGLAADTAARMLEACDPAAEPLLNEITVHSFCDTDVRHDVSVWLRKAAGQRKQADPRQPESLQQVRARADALILKLAQDGGDCVISEKEAHCGGCGHNCFLSNPGCGVGREKALRRSRRG